MIKLICVTDFSSHYFKEVSSLNTLVEQVLKNDFRLDINAPVKKRPYLNNVLHEIKKTRRKVNKYQNDQADSLKKKTPEDFTTLGLTTSRNSQLLSVKVSPYHSNLDQKEQLKS